VPPPCPANRLDRLPGPPAPAVLRRSRTFTDGALLAAPRGRAEGGRSEYDRKEQIVLEAPSWAAFLDPSLS